MKAKFEFELPKDRSDYEIYLDAMETHCFLHEFEEWLRRKYKHENPSSEDAEKEYDEIINKFFKLKMEYLG